MKKAFADRLASKATTLFLQSTGVPDKDTLRILAIMFCPNSEHHPEIAELEDEFARDLVSEAVEDAVTSAGR